MLITTLLIFGRLAKRPMGEYKGGAPYTAPRKDYWLESLNKRTVNNYNSCFCTATKHTHICMRVCVFVLGLQSL